MYNIEKYFLILLLLVINFIYTEFAFDMSNIYK